MRYETLLCNALYKHMGDKALSTIKEVFCEEGTKVGAELKASISGTSFERITGLMKNLQEAKVFGNLQISEGPPAEVCLTDRCISLSSINNPVLCGATCIGLLSCALSEIGVKAEITPRETRASGSQRCVLEFNIN